MSVADASSVSATGNTGKSAPCKSHSAFQWLDFFRGAAESPFYGGPGRNISIVQ